MLYKGFEIVNQVKADIGSKIGRNIGHSLIQWLDSLKRWRSARTEAITNDAWRSSGN